MPLNWKKTIYAYLVLFFATLLLVPSTLAQTSRGAVSGVVVDTQGAVIANAVVKLKNPATRFGRASCRERVCLYV